MKQKWDKETKKALILYCASFHIKRHYSAGNRKDIECIV